MVATPATAAATALLNVDSAGRSGPDNMARDCRMLVEARPGRAAVRLYRWDPACMSLGRNETALTRYDTDRITTLALPVVRRPTGGRAVWHADEITYAVAGSIEDFDSLRKTYEWIHLLLALGLRRLGVAASLARGRHPAPVDAGACFASPVGGEVVVNGRKLVGSAQVRAGGRFLQHGSILLNDTQEMLQRVTRGQVAAPAATSLSRVLGRPVGFDDAAPAIAAGLGDGFARVTSWDGPQPDRDELARFADSDWTWRR